MFLPSIDILHLEKFSVVLGPRAQLLQPWNDLFWCPMRHRFTNQQVVLLQYSAAPVVHQHHHLDTIGNYKNTIIQSPILESQQKYLLFPKGD